MKFFPHLRGWERLLIALAGVALLTAASVLLMTGLPDLPDRWSGGPPLTLGELQAYGDLQNHVQYLAGAIGERNLAAYAPLERAAQYIEKFLKEQGYKVQSQEYKVEGRKVRNLIAEIPGGARANEIVVIGAHYDTVRDCPGADDNTSGVAVLLELAAHLQHGHPARTLRLVFFVNEEPPWFQTENMGSWVYAKEVHRKKENVVAAVSLETIGMYSEVEGSQHYPAGLRETYPSKGNFIAFVGNPSSRPLLEEAVRSFRAAKKIPAEVMAAPDVTPGVGWSDHWSFWQEGYPAIMVTDTAPFRNPNYHRPSDKPDTLDYDRMARVTLGLFHVVKDLGQYPSSQRAVQ
jgi:Zn-dependent M28 family amino/carboxypeptidase